MKKDDLKDFSDWMRLNEMSDSTIKAYMNGVKSYFNSFDDFSQQGISEYKIQLVNAGANVNTINLEIAALRKYAEYADTEISIRSVRTQKRSSIENVISDTDYRRLLDSLKSDGDLEGYYRVRFLAGTGARISELVQMKKKHLFCGEMTIPTKGKVRTVYIPKSLLEESAEYFGDLEDESYLFQANARRCGHRNAGKPICRETITGQMQRWAERYEIPKEVMHPHSFRHRFALNFLKRNSDLTLLADLMGHSNLNTTMIYTRMSKEEQKRTIDEVMDW